MESQIKQNKDAKPKTKRMTFTSLKKTSTIPYQKPVYGLDEFKVRRLVSDKVLVRIQSGVEFDVEKELGPDGNPNFRKLVEVGYLQNGKTVKLDPEAFQRFLEAQVDAGTNKVIPWANRPRSDEEKRLEAVINAKDSVIMAKDIEIEDLRKLLESNTSPKK